MKKPTAKDWLEVTNRCLEQEEYGDEDTCEFCKYCDITCHDCLFFMLFSPEDDFENCEDYFRMIKKDIWGNSTFSVEVVRLGLAEIKKALEDYVNG